MNAHLAALTHLGHALRHAYQHDVIHRIQTVIAIISDHARTHGTSEIAIFHAFADGMSATGQDVAPRDDLAVCYHLAQVFLTKASEGLPHEAHVAIANACLAAADAVTDAGGSLAEISTVVEPVRKAHATL